MAYKIEVTRQYLKDLRLARKRMLEEKKLNEVIAILASGDELPRQNRDYALSGDYQGCRECHVLPDWLLIYSKKETLKIISLVRTGTHSDLF